jgi:L-iditol 2-dehydrogenase
MTAFMKSILYKDGSAVLAETKVPEPGPGEVVIAVEACGLCGTDIMKLGTKPAAAVLGHELCGRVAKAGRGAALKEGTRVVAAHHVPCGDCHYCRRGSESMCRQFKATNVAPGGFSEYVLLSALHVKHTTFIVPDGLDSAAASQMEPLACCLRNAKRIGAREGDVIGIVGMGAIGQLTARLLARAFGARVIGLDLDPNRAAALKGYGNGVTDFAAFESAARAESSGRGLDTLIMSVGTPALAATAVPLVRDGGTLNVFASFHPDPVMPLDLNQVYHRELTILSSYSPALGDLKESLDLIASRRVDPVFADQKAYGLDRFDDAVADVRARRATKAILVPLERVAR